MKADVDMAAPANTQIMRIVHSAVRRDLTRAQEALREPPFPFAAQREAIGKHLTWMMHFLHHHHESEDEHLYPLVRQRNPDAGPLLDEMNTDHQSVLPAIEAVERAAAAYQDSADARTTVIAALDKLSEVLLPHLDREENEMMPVVSAAITEAEWRQWDEEYNVKPLNPVELSDTGLFIMDHTSPGDHQAIAELVPPVPRWLILHVMIKRYRRSAFRRWRTPEFSPLKAPLAGQSQATTTAQPAAVWDILTDVTRIGEWSHECRRARWLGSTRTAAPGVRFRGENKSGFMRWSRSCTFTAVDPPRELVWITHGGSIYDDSTEWRFVLEPVDGGTRITQSFRILSLPVWFDRMIHTLVPAHHNRSNALQEDLIRLARLAEAAPA